MCRGVSAETHPRHGQAGRPPIQWATFMELPSRHKHVCCLSLLALSMLSTSTLASTNTQKRIGQEPRSKVHGPHAVRHGHALSGRQVLRHVRRQPGKLGSDRHTPVLLCIRPGVRNGQTSNSRYSRSGDWRRRVTPCSVTVQPQWSSSRAWTMKRERGRALS